jgi:hypothetical protein
LVGYTAAGFDADIKNQEPCVARKLAVVKAITVASTFRQLREHERYRRHALKIPGVGAEPQETKTKEEVFDSST